MQHSASFAAKQIQSVVTSQAKAIVKLEALSKKLKRGELPKATLSSVKEKVSEIVSPQHLKKIISIDTTLKDNRPVLTYFLNRDALQELVDYHFGRTLLFTNRHDWSNDGLFWDITGNLKSRDTSRTARILITFLFNLLITGQTKSCMFTPFIVI